MAQLRECPKVSCDTHFTVDEEELRALDALAGYGDDAFVEAFYERLGAAYMKKHEEGLRKFLCSIRLMAPTIIRKLDKAREVFGNG